MALPTDKEVDANYIAADYRVRLFLSVDLSGSTAFKNSAVGAAPTKGATPLWVDAFETFYDKFPAQFHTKYLQRQNNLAGTDQAPRLWKAVGDELVFCGRISNRLSAILAILAFVDTMNEYRKRLQDEKTALGLKGAAWLAAFPEPNRAVQLRHEGSDKTSLVSASEALEMAADRRPFDYDFLGKAIDTGFRVARWAEPERFVLSVQLARLLLEHGEGDPFPQQIWMETPQPLKGVNNGQPYPVLYFDTLKHLPIERVKDRERAALGLDPVTARILSEYLDEYCKVVGTDEIALAEDDSRKQPGPPESYLKIREKLSEHLRQEALREHPSSDEDEPEDGSETLEETANLEPLSEDPSD